MSLQGNIVLLESIEADDYIGAESEEKPVVEVRAVLINCQLEVKTNLLEVPLCPIVHYWTWYEPMNRTIPTIRDLQGGSDTEASRFQREELFKHNVLRDCKKKLALALKLSSEPDQNSDEYIPIDHISDGANKKRIRLLNPYVLRVRWDSPLQAYKLRRVDTVTGLLTGSIENHRQKKENKYKNNRLRRDSIALEKASEMKHHNLESTSSIHRLKHSGRGSYSDKFGDLLNLQGVSANIRILGQGPKVETESCTKLLPYNQSLMRDKRHEHNIMIEQTSDEFPWRSNPHSSNVGKVSARIGSLAAPARIPLKYHNPGMESLKPRIPESKKEEGFTVLHKTPLMIDHVRSEISNIQRTDSEQDARQSDLSSKIDKTDLDIELPYESASKKRSKIDLGAIENNFAVYEIGNPGLWCTAKVQLYEKLSTPEGKTVWNDLTRGETVKISSLKPEWGTQDVNIKYRQAEWIVKDDYNLPFTTSLYLLVPLSAENDSTSNFKTINDNENSKEYIIVPSEDLVPMDNGRMDMKKRDEYTSESSYTHTNRQYRNVLIRVSRALFIDGEDNLNIVRQEARQYLTLPHRKPHRVLIDVEVRADNNELIIVGSTGRITTAVSDNTRRTRTVVTVQATNTGLAAATYRLKARDCGPDLSDLINKKDYVGTTTGPILLPPRHTRQLSLELPTEVPGGIAHCSVALINDEDEAVAVRDVAIRKGDRCFCVWHCDCVCLSEDPKLQCREMTDMQQAAAGLTIRKKLRQVRSVSYQDIQCLDICAVIIGVISFLLLLGFVKACVGLVLRCVGSWGLHRVVKMPRKISHYYETSLRDVAVQYDNDGWPVHPHTKQRTVRMISKYMEFTLNLVFFLIIPGIVVYDAVTQIKSRCKISPNSESKCHINDAKTCFSTTDLQRLERRRHRRTRMQRWMSPEAQDLSANIWHEGLNPYQIVNCDFMRPLLREEYRGRVDEMQSSCVDSEQDDTEYVLMRMQESRESLARTQKKIDSNSPSARIQDNSHVKQTTTGLR